MSYETILFEASDGVATITLNRPDKLNALNPQMFADLDAALDRVEADAGLRCLMITGSGRGFCAGADLTARDMESAAPDLGQSLIERYNPLVLRLTGLDRPVIAAVNGVAAGAGCNLALAADIVIAARSASFMQAFVRIGLMPDAGGTWILPRLAGQARAMGMAMLGEALPADQAAAWGMIWSCVDDDALMTEAGSLAGRLAKGPTLALGHIKAAIRASTGNDLEAQLALEARHQAILGRSRDYREGVAAFRDKRPAVYTGE
jgi:2-(1,2-epoxy-1,2-dihydrophenyl)acetyl-CoA isomerase